jgi:hypothetical protein
MDWTWQTLLDLEQKRIGTTVSSVGIVSRLADISEYKRTSGWGAIDAMFSGPAQEISPRNHH